MLRRARGGGGNWVWPPGPPPTPFLGKLPLPDAGAHPPAPPRDAGWWGGRPPRPRREASPPGLSASHRPVAKSGTGTPQPTAFPRGPPLPEEESERGAAGSQPRTTHSDRSPPSLPLVEKSVSVTPVPMSPPAKPRWASSRASGLGREGPPHRPAGARMGSAGSPGLSAAAAVGGGGLGRAKPSLSLLNHQGG